MRQTAASGPVGAAGWAVRGALVMLALAAGGYAVSTLPGVRSTPGFVPLLDGWVQGPAFVLAALVAVLRPALSRVDRLVWSLVAIALALRASAYLVHFPDISTRLPRPDLSPADVGWLVGSLVLLATLVVLLRPRGRPVSLLLVLDTLAAALAAGGIAVALLWETLVDRLSPTGGTSVVAVNLALPLLDVALLVMCAGYLAFVRWRPSRGPLTLMVGIVALAVVDAVLRYQITAGTFRPASPLTGLNMVASATIAYAAWVDRRPIVDAPPPAAEDPPASTGRQFWLGPRGVLLPLMTSLVCVVALVLVAVRDQPPASAGLPLAGLVVVITRGVFTLFTERSAAEHAMLLKSDELLRFQSLVEATTDFIAIAAMDGSVLYVNPAGRDLVGFDSDVDVTKTTITDYLTEEGVRASLEVEQPAVVAQGHWEGESTLRDHRGGPPIPVMISSFLMLHPTTREPIALATVQRDITERQAAETARQELADQRQELLDRLVQAQEDERARIAADVHDDSVQALAAVELRLGLLRRRLSTRAPDLLQGIDEMTDTVGTATERLRHLLFDLDSPALHDDLAGALDQAASYVFGDQLAWGVVGDRDVDLPQGLRVTAYRIAKEAMVNAHKHAGADRVDRRDRPRRGRRRGAGDRQRPRHPSRRPPGPARPPRDHEHARPGGGGRRVAAPRHLPEGGTVVRLWLPDQPAIQDA